MPVPNDKAVELALWRCASEPVQAPGAIQGNGALLAVDRSTGLISYVSNNIGAFLNVRVTDVLGKKADHVFSRAVIKAWGLKGIDDAVAAKCDDLGAMTIGAQSLWVTTACAGEYKIIAFETAPKAGGDKPLFDTCLAEMEITKTENDLFESSVRLSQAATGYDRVMLLRFGAQGHGQVVAEASSDGSTRFKGLMFPSWDIPAQARDLMMKFPYRYITDVDAPSVQIRAADPSCAPLDMTHLHLRGTSLLHLEYLRNMGASATLTLNLMERGRLWGMMAFHHGSPRVPSAQLRRDCVSIARAFTQKLTALCTLQQQQTVLDLTDALRQSAKQDRGDTLARICRAFQADGCLYYHAGRLVRWGQTPPVEVSRDFLVRRKWPQGVSVIPGLHDNGPRAQNLLCDQFASTLIIRPSRDRILALCREQASQHIAWAGAPDKTMRKADGRLQLAPRTSFAAHTEALQGHKRAWSPEHVEFAQALCAALAEAAKS